MHHENISPVLLLIINGIFGLTTVLIACELGQRMNGAFEEVSITIEQFDWFLFPTKTQRMLPMIIGDAQQPVSFECFGSIKCSREVFESVGIKQWINNQTKFLIAGRLCRCFIFFFRLSVAHFHTLWCSVNLALENKMSSSSKDRLKRFQNFWKGTHI